MQQNVKVIFESQEEILNTIHSESDIVEMLGLPSEKCALMGTTIQLTEFLGGGVQGQAFLIEFPGMGEKLYVVKKADLDLGVLKGTQEELEVSLDLRGLSWDKIEKWQPESFIEAWENADHHTELSVVIPPKMCLQKENSTFPCIPNNAGDIKILDNNSVAKIEDDEITVPKGSFVCDNNSFSELLIAIYTGKLYRDGICANFFNTYSMFTCIKPKDKQHSEDFVVYQQYTFMDKIDGELNKYIKCITWDQFVEEEKRISPDIVNGIYVQTLFAIAAYQRTYNISHNDLHTGNLFVEKVTDKTMFGGQKVIDCDYYHYRISNTDLYIPAIPMLAKIGDYGLSIKFSKPLIGPYEVLEDGMNTDDGTGAWIPTAYIPQYDSLYFTTDYINGTAKNGAFSNATPLISNSLRFMCPDITAEDRASGKSVSEVLQKYMYIKLSNDRPILRNLVGVKSAIEVLLDPVHKFYHLKPKTGKIITMGTI